MELKKTLQGGLAATLMVGLLSFGAAAQTSSATDQNTSMPTAKHHHKAATSSDASSSSSSQLSAADKAFVTKAAQGGQAEVELGQLAADKGQSQQVKDFGQKMVQDHTKANDQLKSIASQKNVTLPTSLDAKDQALKDRLSKLSGDQFDKVYMQHMVMDHKKDVAEFKKEANSGKDSDVKSFAQQTVPTLEEHLKMAEQAAPAKSAARSKKSSTSASNQQQ